MESYRNLAAAILLAVSGIAAQAAVLQMQNGDRITGDVSRAKSAGGIVVHTTFGELSVPKSAVKCAVNTDGSQVLDIPLPEKLAVDAAEGQTEAAPQPSPAVDDAASKPKTPEDPQWVQDYRSYVKELFPEDWQFRVRGGIEYRKTSSSSTSYEFAADVRRVWDTSSFDATLYYNYATETVSGNTGKTADRYGINTAFRQDFDKATNWYFQNLATYKVDWVKGIRDQCDEAITIGYRFEWEEYDLTLDVAPGPAIRYVNADGYDQHWVAMAVLAEELTWKISTIFRFEQKGYLGINLTNYHKYTANLNIGLVARVTAVMDIALRYYYEYDAINSGTAQKTEQRLLLAFEFPFNWQY